MKWYKTALTFTLLILLFPACTAVLPYQRAYINDPDMEMGKNTGAAFEDYVHNIREGGTVPGGAKPSGGCGCN